MRKENWSEEKFIEWLLKADIYARHPHQATGVWKYIFILYSKA
jgi:hypothetical protein